MDIWDWINIALKALEQDWQDARNPKTDRLLEDIHYKLITAMDNKDSATAIKEIERWLKLWRRW